MGSEVVFPGNAVGETLKRSCVVDESCRSDLWGDVSGEMG